MISTINLQNKYKYQYLSRTCNKYRSNVRLNYANQELTKKEKSV